MTRCILHIGMPQTGAAAIQQSLDGLSNERFLYARLDSPDHELALYSIFAPHPEDHPTHKSEGRDAAMVSAYSARMRAALEQSLREAGSRILLLSGEDIARIPPEGLYALRDFLQLRCDGIDLVGYVRAPGALMAGCFQQRVKAGAAISLDLERDYRGYRERFERLDKVFGRDHVHLWKYDPEAFPGGSVARDLCEKLGIRLAPERFVSANESLPRQAVALLHVYRKYRRKCGFAAITKSDGAALADLLAATGNDPFRFSAQALAPVLEMNRADIRWMEERLGTSLEEDHEDGAGGVSTEADLLAPDPQAAARLVGLLGADAPPGNHGATAEELARLVHALREKHFPAGPGQRRRRRRQLAVKRRKSPPVSVAGLIDAIRQENATLLDRVPGEQAAQLVRAVLRHINRTLASSDPGTTIAYAGLGRFVVKNARQGADDDARRPPVIRFLCDTREKEESREPED